MDRIHSQKYRYNLQLVPTTPLSFSRPKKPADMLIFVIVFAMQPSAQQAMLNMFDTITLIEKKM